MKSSTRGCLKLTFNIYIPTVQVTLYVLTIEPNNAMVKEPQESHRIPVSKALKVLAILPSNLQIRLRSIWDWNLQGDYDECEDCEIGRGGQKYLNIQSNHVVAEKFEKGMFLDTEVHNDKTFSE
jgi:hypothetical protein